MKCSQCDKEFEGRNDAKFCSGKCKMQFIRNKRNKPVTANVTDNDLSVTKDDLSVTDVTATGELVTDNNVTDVTDNLPVIEVTDKDLEFNASINEMASYIREALMKYPQEERLAIWEKLKEGTPL
jgi:hypothetical protein